MKSVKSIVLFLVVWAALAAPAHAQRYTGQVIWGGWNFCPQGYLPANGQLLPISEFETLFNLIGTTYGGDGQTTFALPDMQGRVTLHQGQGNGLSNRLIGEVSGSESFTMSVSQMPAHSHALVASGDPGTSRNPDGKFLAKGGVYRANAADLANMNPASVQPTGGNQPVQKMPPFLGITACISVYGIYPPPS